MTDESRRRWRGNENHQCSDGKICKECGYERPLDMYLKNPGMKDGHSNTCKLCTKAYQARRKSNIYADPTAVARRRAIEAHQDKANDDYEIE